MEQLTKNDRGTFIVTTRSGTKHLWVITDDGVTVQRQPSPDHEGHWSMHGFPTEPYRATVKMWPEVGLPFLNIINGGHGDIPWTRSSSVRSIERVA